MNKSRIDNMICRREGVFELNREKIEEIQLNKLNSLLIREKQRGGFYKDLPERLEKLSDLKNLPFTTDEDLAGNPGGLLLVSQSKIQRVLSDATSGTTGKAKRVFYTPGDCEKTVDLFEAGLGELIFPGSVTMVCFPFSGPFGLGDLIAEALTRLGARTLKTGVGRTFGELKEILEKEQPDTFVGMPSTLLSMLRFCGKKSLKRALVSGDACPDSVIKACEDILGTKLFPHYGSREMGLGGAICCPAHEGMHLRENDVIAEIIDDLGNTLPKGEYGQLVITTVGMEAMPLIRYKTGDYTRILPEKCPCGSDIIRLAPLLRRGASGRAAALDEALFSIEGLIDCMAKREGDIVNITALTDGTVTPEMITEKAKVAMPDKNYTVNIKRAEPDDRPLFFAKRTIS